MLLLGTEASFLVSPNRLRLVPLLILISSLLFRFEGDEKGVGEALRLTEGLLAVWGLLLDIGDGSLMGVVVALGFVVVLMRAFGDVNEVPAPKEPKGDGADEEAAPMAAAE